MFPLKSLRFPILAPTKIILFQLNLDNLFCLHSPPLPPSWIFAFTFLSGASYYWNRQSIFIAGMVLCSLDCSERGSYYCSILTVNFFFLHLPAETVVYRIFYYVNRSGNGRLTLRELRRSDLIAAMQHADEEDDINKVLRYICLLQYWLNICLWEV